MRALTESFYGRVARLYVLKSADDKPQAKVRLSAADGGVPAPGRGAAARLRAAASARGEEYELVATLYPSRGMMKLRRPGGLWLHRDFRNLWAAETISVFGRRSRSWRCRSSP